MADNCPVVVRQEFMFLGCFEASVSTLSLHGISPWAPVSPLKGSSLASVGLLQGPVQLGRFVILRRLGSREGVF